jgi:hypothetical protein
VILQNGLFSDEAHQAQGARVENDYYPTPEAITRLLLKHVPMLPQRIMEPCAGAGAISEVLRTTRRTVRESDISWDTDSPKDASDPCFWAYWGEVAPFATVTNPPFNLASKILPLAYEHSPWGVAFLLRLSYLEPAADRAQWLTNHADNLRWLIPVNPRPRFRRDSKGTDSSTVAWMVWQKDWSWRELGVRSPFQFEAGWR